MGQVKRAVSAAVLAGLALGGCTTPYMRARAAEKAQDSATAESMYSGTYVALGSSFAAGPGLPPPKPGGPARCGRSLSNYPTLLAEQYGMMLIDATCSGAQTVHVLGPWNEVPPQIDAVKADARLVTVTIGGNDLSYVGNLFIATCLSRAGADAQRAAACGTVRKPTDADYAKVEANMTEIARQVRLRAPKARLVFVQYLTPLGGKSCAASPVRAEDAATIRGIGKRLAEITARVAATAQATTIEINQTSATHTPCDAEPWLFGAPGTFDAAKGLAWHPTPAGMRATADGIAYWLSRSAPTVRVEPRHKPEPTVAEPAAGRN
jgi:lysophospholipase L1-like esterase